MACDFFKAIKWKVCQGSSRAFIYGFQTERSGASRFSKKWEILRVWNVSDNSELFWQRFKILKGRFYWNPKSLRCSLFLSVFLSCATAPPPRQIQNSWQIDQPFDDVWQAVIEVLPEMQLAIAQTEKESGLITTNPIDLTTGDRTYCDWGNLAGRKAKRDFEENIRSTLKKSKTPKPS